jgi:hypothetical protein
MMSPESMKRWVNLLIFGTTGLIVVTVLLTFSLEQHYSKFKPLSKYDYLQGKVSSVRLTRILLRLLLGIQSTLWDTQAIKAMIRKT